MPQDPSSKRLVSATQMSPVTESQLESGSDAIVDHEPPYGELQAVEHLKCLGCCHCFQFAETKVSPQCFCAEDLVGEIVKELKKRMKARGDTGQIQRAEQMLVEVRRVGEDVAAIRANVEAIMDHLRIEWKPAVQVMDRTGRMITPMAK